MHVAVFADMEGSFGIWRKRQCMRGTPEWQYGRECLTCDVNSVIKGALDAGADKVTVKDTHDTGFNCIRKKLHPQAGYHGGPYVKPTVFGPVSHYDMVLYVAIHAGSGTKDAFFPHTHFGEFTELRLNGKPICEMELYGGCFGEIGIPIGFASGEDIAVHQAAIAMPWLKTVLVDKRKAAYTSGEQSLAYIKKGRKLLQEQAAETVRKASEMRPLVHQGPFHFEAVFSSDKKAKRYNTWGLQQSGNIIQWDCHTMMDGFHTINKLSWFPRNIYPFLPFLLFLFRCYYRTKNNYFPPPCNREGAVDPWVPENY
jgi:D-amino peptidase